MTLKAVEMFQSRLWNYKMTHNLEAYRAMAWGFVIANYAGKDNDNANMVSCFLALMKEYREGDGNEDSF